MARPVRWCLAVCVLLLVGGHGAWCSPVYTLTDLGYIAYPYTVPMALNDSGQVAGLSKVNSFHAHAFLWTVDAMQDLGTLGGSQSHGRDVNNSGVVVGWANPTGSGNMVGFVYQSGVMTSLGTFGGTQSWATGINDAGTIGGWASLSNGNRHAFRRVGTTKTDLGTLGGSESIGLGINGNGDIVGWSDMSWGTNHPFKVVGSTMTDLGVPGGLTSGGEAWSINDSGVVVGWGEVVRGGAYHALLWDAGGWHDLGSLAGTDSQAYAINEAGQVVGWSDIAGDTAYHAFLYEKGTMYDLNDLVLNGTGYVIGTASDINENGDICATATFGTETRGVLLTRTSVPEPGTIGLFALGLAGMVWVSARRRRSCV